MNIIGKIFVFAVFIMSLVFMSFGVALYSTHTNCTVPLPTLTSSHLL